MTGVTTQRWGAILGQKGWEALTEEHKVARSYHIGDIYHYYI